MTEEIVSKTKHYMMSGSFNRLYVQWRSMKATSLHMRVLTPLPRVLALPLPLTMKSIAIIVVLMCIAQSRGLCVISYDNFTLVNATSDVLWGPINGTSGTTLTYQIDHATYDSQIGLYLQMDPPVGGMPAISASMNGKSTVGPYGDILIGLSIVNQTVFPSGVYLNLQLFGANVLPNNTANNLLQLLLTPPTSLQLALSGTYPNNTLAYRSTFSVSNLNYSNTGNGSWVGYRWRNTSIDILIDGVSVLQVSAIDLTPDGSVFPNIASTPAIILSKADSFVPTKRYNCTISAYNYTAAGCVAAPPSNTTTGTTTAAATTAAGAITTTTTAAPVVVAPSDGVSTGTLVAAVAVGATISIVVLGAFIALVLGMMKRWKTQSDRMIQLSTFGQMSPRAGTSAPRPQGDTPLESMNVPVITEDKITIIRQLGKGAMGTVHLAKWGATDVAYKRFDVSQQRGGDIANEMSLLASLRHPNIIQLLAIVRGPITGVLIEFMERGSLQDILQDHNTGIPFETIVDYALQTAMGLDYLHHSVPPVVHRDIKSANVLVSEAGKAKIADFGISTLKTTEWTMTACGSPYWMAPEVLLNQRYDEKADVYSFGLLMWEMIARKTPFGHLQPTAVMIEVTQRKFRPPILPDWDPDYTQLMVRCWNHNPDNRPTMEEVVHALQSLRTLLPRSSLISLNTPREKKPPHRV